TLMIRPSSMGLLLLNGQLVFNGGTSAQSSTARIILLRPAFSPKHGGTSLAISVQRSSSQFFPTKICVASARHLCRSAIRLCSQKSAANAPPRPKGWPKLWLTSLHHSPTPLLGPLPRHLNSRVRNRIRSLSLAPCILLAKFSLISVSNRL